MKVSKELIDAICQNKDELGYKYSEESITATANLIFTYLFDFKKVTTYKAFMSELSSLLIRVERRHNGLVIFNDLVEAKIPMDNVLFKELMSHSTNFDENLLCFVGNSLLSKEPTWRIVEAFFSSKMR